MIEYSDFEQVDIRCGVIVRAEVFAQARKPAYKLWIDFGPEVGQKRSSAQITKHYQPQELVGKSIIGVVNFAPKQIGPFVSEVLTLGLADENGAVVLVSPDRPVPPGAKLF